MKKKITLAAYLAGVTTLAVSLPAMAETQNDPALGKSSNISESATQVLREGDEN